MPQLPPKGYFAYPLPQDVYVVMFQDYGDGPGTYQGERNDVPGHPHVPFHTGIDLDCARGTNVLAAANGVVVQASWDDTGFGNLIRLSHNGGMWFSMYAHLNDFTKAGGGTLTQGETVTVGEVIGHVDSTGNSSGDHLHFELRTGGWGSDFEPWPYMYNVPPGIAPPGKTTAAGPARGVIPPPAQAPGTTASTPGANSPKSVQGATSAALPVTPSMTLQDIITRAKNARSGVLAITPAASQLAVRSGAIQACCIDINVGGSFGQASFPVLRADCALPSFGVAGTWSATIDMEWMRRHIDRRTFLRLLAGRNVGTQIALYMGYVDPIYQGVVTSSVTGMIPLFAGTIVGNITQGGLTQNLDVSGPDMSGLLSTQSQTVPDISIFSGLSATDVVRQLMTAHGLGYYIPPGTDDLVDTTTDLSTVSTNTPGQTEWDVITQLASMNGFVCFFDGTSLYFGPLPPTGSPLHLLFHAAEGHLQDFADVSLAAQPHGKGDYRVVARSYNSKTKGTDTGEATTQDGTTTDPFTAASTGNTGTVNVIYINMPKNTPVPALTRKAQAVLDQYLRTELILAARFDNALRLYRSQPIVLHSERIEDLNLGKPYYPAWIGYSFDAQGGAGIGMSIQATSRPFSIQTTQQNASDGNLQDFLGGISP
jgi:murein DD-endopeptidase MepM/ murein hydrolase activator NlpD